MTDRVYLRTHSDSIDSLEADALRLRLDAAIEIAKPLKVGTSKDVIDPADKRQVRPDIDRHATYYGHADKAPADDKSFVLRTSISFNPRAGQDRLQLHFPPAFDRLGLTLTEPVSSSDFNRLDRSAPTRQVVAILTRWRAWLDRIVLPIASPFRDQMDADYNRSARAVLELLRANGYSSRAAMVGFYNFDLSSPYRPPQVSLHGDTTMPDGKPVDCFTPAGQAALADILPTMLRLTAGRTAAGYELQLKPALIEGHFMTLHSNVFDQLKALASLPDLGDEMLVQPLPEAIAA